MFVCWLVVAAEVSTVDGKDKEGKERRKEDENKKEIGEKYIR